MDMICSHIFGMQLPTSVVTHFNNDTIHQYSLFGGKNNRLFFKEKWSGVIVVVSFNEAIMFFE